MHCIHAAMTDVHPPDMPRSIRSDRRRPERKLTCLLSTSRPFDTWVEEECPMGESTVYTGVLA